MAQPPDINETFVREVDENLRRDQLRDFFKAHGSLLAAGIILFLVVYVFVGLASALALPASDDPGATTHVPGTSACVSATSSTNQPSPVWP